MLITTIPKSGTKLLKRILFQAGADTAMSHTPYDAALLDGGGRAICLIRDPRDIVVSTAHYAARGGIGSRAMARIAQSDRELRALVYFGGVAKYVNSFDGWTTDPRCLTLRFEEIVGPAGGGGDEARMAAADRLADWLDLPRDRTRSAMEVGSDTSTFRRGIIGAWRDEMEPELAEIIAELSGEVMRRWGYLPAGQAPAPASAE